MREIDYKVSRDVFDIRNIKCQNGMDMRLDNKPVVGVSVRWTDNLFMMMAFDNLCMNDILEPIFNAADTGKAGKFYREVLIEVAGNTWVFTMKACLLDKKGILRLIYEFTKELN